MTTKLGLVLGLGLTLTQTLTQNYSIPACSFHTVLYEKHTFTRRSL